MLMDMHVHGLTISVLSDQFCSVPACTGITGKHLPLLPS